MAPAFKRWTGIALQQSFTAEIESARRDGGGEGRRGRQRQSRQTQINVGSSVVKTAVESIMASQTFKTAIAETGMTPNRLASIIAGEIGKLQAQMTAAAPAAPSGKALS